MIKSLREFFESFQPLGDAEFALLESGLIRRRFEKNEIFLRAGEVCPALAFVERGMMRAFRLRDDAEITENFYLENSLAGDHRSFTKQIAASVTVDAVEACEVLIITRNLVEEFCAASATWREIRRLVVENEFVATQRRVANLLADSPEQRYLRLREENPAVLQRAPQYMIASYLGVKPESLSRIRHRLATHKAEVFLT